MPYLINSGANLYSLCKWGEGGNLTYIYNSQTGKPDPINNGYVTPQKQVGNELIGNLVERLNSFSSHPEVLLTTLICIRDLKSLILM